jgi:DNA-binding PadR family transcriptional regulator
MSRPTQNCLGLAVLSLLAERPMHPYEMASTLRERHKEKSIKLRYGSLYTVIETLQRDGLIAEQEKVREGRRPERTVFELTPSGQAELERWMTDILSLPVKEYPQFEAGLSLMPVLAPDTVAKLLEERLKHLAAHIETTRKKTAEVEEAGVAPLFLIENEYHLALCEAEHRFVAELLDRIRSDALRGMELWRSWHAKRPFEGAIAAPHFQ